MGGHHPHPHRAAAPPPTDPGLAERGDLRGVNAALTAAAVLTGQGAVTVACLILAPMIYTAVLLLLVLPPRPRGPEPRPR